MFVCVSVCPQLQQHRRRHRHHHRPSESEVSQCVCVCVGQRFPPPELSTRGVCFSRSAEVTVFLANQSRGSDMAVVAYFLLKLIVEASGPQAKIMTHNSFSFFFLNVIWAFFCFCSRGGGGGVSHSLPRLCVKMCVFVCQRGTKQFKDFLCCSV